MISIGRHIIWHIDGYQGNRKFYSYYIIKLWLLFLYTFSGECLKVYWCRLDVVMVKFEFRFDQWFLDCDVNYSKSFEWDYWLLIYFYLSTLHHQLTYRLVCFPCSNLTLSSTRPFHLASTTSLCCYCSTCSGILLLELKEKMMCTQMSDLPTIDPLFQYHTLLRSHLDWWK